MDKLKTHKMRSFVLLSITNTHKKDNSKQSKVEDMAKAKLEGNGVMFSSDEET